jgi:hypothetical protein
MKREQSNAATSAPPSFRNSIAPGVCSYFANRWASNTVLAMELPGQVRSEMEFRNEVLLENKNAGDATSAVKGNTFITGSDKTAPLLRFYGATVTILLQFSSP